MVEKNFPFPQNLRWQLYTTPLWGCFLVEGVLGLTLSLPDCLSFQFKVHKERCSRNKGESQLVSQDNRWTDAVCTNVLQKSVGSLLLMWDKAIIPSPGAEGYELDSSFKTSSFIWPQLFSAVCPIDMWIQMFTLESQNAKPITRSTAVLAEIGNYVV